MKVRHLCAGLALMACASCFRAHGPSPFAEPSEGGGGVLEVKVMNLNYSDATLWIVARGGMKRRLGFVTGKDEGFFRVPWTFSTPMNIEIDLVAGPKCVTDTLTADPGDLIEVRIAVAFSDANPCRSWGD